MFVYMFCPWCCVAVGCAWLRLSECRVKRQLMERFERQLMETDASSTHHNSNWQIQLFVYLYYSMLIVCWCVGMIWHADAEKNGWRVLFIQSISTSPKLKTNQSHDPDPLDPLKLFYVCISAIHNLICERSLQCMRCSNY